MAMMNEMEYRTIGKDVYKRQGLGCTLTVLFVGFPNIPDNQVEVIQNHVAEILIIADMGSLQHLQMRVIFAGAIRCV